MKIAFVVTAQTHEGPLKVVKTLIEGLTERHHSCTLLYLEDREVLDLPCVKRKISYRQEIDLSEFDVVHSHGMKPDFFVWLYLRRNKHKSSKTVFVSTYHSFIFEDFQWKYGSFWGRVLGRLFLKLSSHHDRIIVLSDAALEYYSEWIPKDKMVRCYHGIPPYSRTNCLPREQTGNIMVGTCCALEKIKGVDLLIDAVKALPDHYHLMVVGNGSLWNVLHQKDPLGKRVTFVGDVRDPFSYYEKMDVFVMASYSEGFCLALMEAASTGTELVCSDIPGMREKFSDEEVTYFEKGNSRDLMTAIQKAASSDKGEKAYKKSLSFSTERMVNNHLKIYETLIKS